MLNDCHYAVKKLFAPCEKSFKLVNTLTVCDANAVYGFTFI